MADKTPLVERLLLSVMGPASVGDPDAPVREVTLPEEICPSCHKPRSTHPVTRDRVLGSVSECPGPDQM
jgi:hypothetical protein